METPHERYALGTFDKPHIRDEISISQEDYSYCSGILDKFLKLSADENLFRIVEFNYLDFESKLNSYLTKNYQLDFYEFDYLFVEMNRLILNLLSSMRTYLDHIETRLKREFGSKSEEYLLFKTETASAFDTFFEYRFLYKLRNYAQHCGLPAGSAEITAYQNSELIHRDKMNVFFSRDKLLSQYDDWGSLVKEELKLMPESFDVLPFVQKIFELLRAINEKINFKIRQQYIEDARFLLNILPRLAHLVGKPCLIKMEGIEEIKITFKSFPFEHISKITGVEINFVYLDQAQ